MKTYPFFLLLFVIIAGCSKTKNKDQFNPQKFSNLYAPQDLLDYSIFKPGTYWVYQEQNTKKLDSVHVGYTSNNRVTTVTQTDSIISDDYYMFYTSSYARDSFNASIPYQFSVDYNSWSTTVSKYEKPADYSTILFHSINDNMGAYSIILGDQIAISYKFFPYTVNSFSFDSVMYVDHANMIARSSSQFPLGRKCREYYVRHYGLVRYELSDSGQVWNLLRCNVIQ